MDGRPDDDGQIYEIEMEMEVEMEIEVDGQMKDGDRATVEIEHDALLNVNVRAAPAQDSFEARQSKHLRHLCLQKRVVVFF